MPHHHFLGSTRHRVFLLVALGLATFLMLTASVAASDLKAYRASGPMVYKTDGGNVANAHGATIGRIEGDSYYSASGSLKARLDGQNLYNASGSLVAKFDGSSIYNAQGSLMGKLDNESLANAHGATIGRIEGAGGSGDPATAFLVFLLLGII